MGKETESRVDWRDCAVTINDAARLLGCDPSTVRRLLRNGGLQGFRLSASGRRGDPRVLVSSIQGFKNANAIVPDREWEAPPHRRATALGLPKHWPDFKESVRRLEELGILEPPPKKRRIVSK
jgi:excisionase family DNA binding protein